MVTLAEADVGGWFSDVLPEWSKLLAAAIAGGFVVWLVIRTERHLRLHRARRFWKTIGSRHPFLVLGAPDLEPLSSWEKTGMVGKGDILALMEVEAQLRRLGFSGRIVESKELTARDLESDLVLIGGPDGNSVTATMLGKLDQAVSYGFAKDLGPEPGAVYDKRSSREITPEYDDSGDPTNDYGLIIRSANPLAPEKAEIVILAGCSGYGTVAAAEKLSDQKFLQKLKRFRHFEVLVETTVVRGAHYNTKVRDTREIRRSPAE